MSNFFFKTLYPTFPIKKHQQRAKKPFLPNERGCTTHWNAQVEQALLLLIQLL